MSNYSGRTVETRRQYLSGAAKRRRKRQRIESEVKRRRTLEELGWSVESGKGEDANVDEPVQPSVCGSSESEATSELQCEAATFVAQEGTTDSDQSSSVKSTPESCTQLSPQQLSQSGLSLPSSDPAKWKDLTGTDKEVIVLNGPPQIPSSFPRDFWASFSREHIL